MKLLDSIVVITGASSGIGATTARYLSQKGAIVVLAARNAEKLEKLALELDPERKRAIAVPTDVSHPDQLRRLVDATIATFGRIDVLINNAGIRYGTSIMNTDDAAMQDEIAVNLLAPIRCVQSVIPQMRKQGAGIIINIGSVAGEIATIGTYSVTKFGLRGFNDVLRRELRHEKISVVLIEPGFISTPMISDHDDTYVASTEVVARAIAAAITRPRRKIVVPLWPYSLHIQLEKLLPGLIDWFIGGERFQRLANPPKETTAVNTTRI